VVLTMALASKVSGRVSSGARVVGLTFVRTPLRSELPGDRIREPRYGLFTTEVQEESSSWQLGPERFDFLIL
jgi:hypothetical protein